MDVVLAVVFVPSCPRGTPGLCLPDMDSAALWVSDWLCSQLPQRQVQDDVLGLELALVEAERGVAACSRFVRRRVDRVREEDDTSGVSNRIGKIIKC